VTLIELAHRRFGEWIDALGRDGRADIDQDELMDLASRVRNGEEISILTQGACAIAATGHAAPDADVALPESATLEASAEVVIGGAVMSVALFESFAGEALVHHQTLKLESEHLRPMAFAKSNRSSCAKATPSQVSHGPRASRTSAISLARWNNGFKRSQRTRIR
jgi:hypothetical protein